MTLLRKSAVVGWVVGGLAASALATEYVSYVGSIPVNKPLGRIVADPVRGKVYGITGDGDVVFIDRKDMAVEKTISTGRQLRDLDLHHDNNSLTVLDNVTGEYWNQPPAVYMLDFDLATQTASGITIAQAPLYQMAHGRKDRVVGIATNQWVDAYQVDTTTGAVVGSAWGGYYGGTDWTGPNLFVTNSEGTRLYRTEIGISSIELIAFDTSADNMTEVASRDVGSYSNEPVFLNSTDTSLYVGDLRLDPKNIQNVLGLFPEHILAGTGDNSLAFGQNGVYDPVWGTKLQNMPAGTRMMALGENEQFLYAFDDATQHLHVMSVVPEPGTLTALALGVAVALRRRSPQKNG